MALKPPDLQKSQSGDLKIVGTFVYEIAAKIHLKIIRANVPSKDSFII